MYAEIDSFIPSKAIAATYVANAGISLRRFRRASIPWNSFHWPTPFHGLRRPVGD